MDFTNAITVYKAAFGPGSIFFLEPGNQLALMPDDEDSKLVCIVPEWETPAGFMEKLQKAQRSGKQIFFDAYKDYLQDPYPEDAFY